MDEVGQLLREAREQKGLTIDEVHEQTRVNKKYIEALEAGDYTQLPTPVHVRGFLRNYARYLDLDPEPLLDRYANSEEYQKAPVPVRGEVESITPDSPLPSRSDQPFFDPVNVEVDSGSRRDPESALRLVIIAALVVAIALVANRFLPLLFGREDGSQAVSENIAAVIEDLTSDGAAEGEAEVDATPEPGLEAGSIITSTSRNNADLVLPTPSPTRPTLPATLETIQLKLDIMERAWTEVTIDGDVKFSGIARKGDLFEWEAQDEARVLTGNAIGILVTINDTELGRMGGRGENKEEVWQTTQ